MAKKISQFINLSNLTGVEYIPVITDGKNYKVSFSSIKSSIGKEDIGLDKVDNTSDLEKPVSDLTQLELDKKANILHNHQIEDVVGLDQAIEDKVETKVAGKANAVHTHAISQVDGLTVALADKAERAHVHEIVEVTGLSALITSKANAVHSHAINEVAGLTTTLASIETGIRTDLGDRIDTKAEASHSHVIAQVNGLQTILDEIADSISTMVTFSNVHAAVASAINNANLVSGSQLNTAVNTLSIAIAGKADLIHNHISEHITDLQPVVEDIVSDLGLGIGDIVVGALEW